jgi:hypothetical protein
MGLGAVGEEGAAGMCWWILACHAVRLTQAIDRNVFILIRGRSYKYE